MVKYNHNICQCKQNKITKLRFHFSAVTNLALGGDYTCTFIITIVTPKC